MSTESLDVSRFCAAFDQSVSTGQDRPQFCAFAVTAGDSSSGRCAPTRIRANGTAANAGVASGARPITDTEPTQIAALASVDDVPDCGAVMHIYLPWSLQLEGYPPLGAKALCGHVRVVECEDETNGLDPRACVVCSDLIGLP